MKQDALTITNGLIITREGEPVAGGIRCDGDRIVAIGADVVPQEGDRIEDARGKLITPGLVDLGVFAIDKPALHFGGITRAALMPDQNPPLDRPSTVRYAAQSGKPGLWVHPLAAATRGWMDRTWRKSR
jgi:dihydroorotase